MQTRHQIVAVVANHEPVSGDRYREKRWKLQSAYSGSFEERRRGALTGVGRRLTADAHSSRA